MAEERKIVLDGFVSLEGRFLEKVEAAYLMSQYVTVIERLQTGGYHHDILASGSTLYECTGQERMTAKKIEKLGTDALLIKKAIQDEGEPPLNKVILVAALNRNSWDKEATETFEIQQRDLEANGISLEKVEDYDVLLPLLNEGVLGFAYIQNRLYPVGPEEYGIRFDKSKGEFRKGFAPLDIDKFKRLPQSFLPSLYWGTFYRDLQEQWAKEELEDPLSFLRFWSHYSFPGFGIKFKSVEDIRDLYKKTYRIKTYCFGDYKDNVLTGFAWSRKRTYREVCGFENSDYVDRSQVSALLGRISSAVRIYREEKGGLQERVSATLVASSEDWSPRAWWEARKTAREDICVNEVLRGSDLLTKLLNEGILGFAFAELDYAGAVKDTTNQIKLVGPGIPAIRVREGELSRAEIDKTSPSESEPA